MLESHKQILQEIIDSKGDCLDANRCCRCPFAPVCLTEFVKHPSDADCKISSKQDRLNIALNIMMRHILMDDVDDIRDHFVSGKVL